VLDTPLRMPTPISAAIDPPFHLFSKTVASRHCMAALASARPASSSAPICTLLLLSAAAAATAGRWQRCILLCAWSRSLLACLNVKVWLLLDACFSLVWM
jgi:hypothetical protein